MTPVRIVGHRGAAGVAPENTIPSFLKALEDGAVAVELDVRLSRDGVVVCFHDDRVDRVTNGRGEVTQLDWDDLALLEVMPGAFGGAYPNTRIPTLAEVYAALPPETSVIVELKSDTERGDALVWETLGVIGHANAHDRTRIISFDRDLLDFVWLWSNFPVGVLVSQGNFHTLIPTAETLLDTEAVHPPHALVDEALVAQCRDRGFLVNAWTVNTVEAARRLTDFGVDEITTDFPALLRELGRPP